MNENCKNKFRRFKPCLYPRRKPGDIILPDNAVVETFESLHERWKFDLGHGNYSPDSQAVYLKKNTWYMPGGGVRLVAQREDWHIIHENKYLKINFTSGCLTSKKQYHFGRYYWDAQFPIGIGCWGALWAWRGVKNEWYEEIDFEVFNKSKSKRKKVSVGTYKGQSHPTAIQESSVINCVYPYRRRKIYMIDWQRDNVSFYINGQLVMKIIDNVPQHELFVVMNLAIGRFEKMKHWSEFRLGEVVGELRIYKFIYIPLNK